MMSQGSVIQPPHVAAWLVDLFSPYEQAESIAGDLQEEFAGLASRSGVAFARRWYWWQSVKTIAHLIGAGFRSAPWLIAGTVLGGHLLLMFGSSWPEQVIVGVLQLRRHHVTPYYTRPQFQDYLFWLNNGIWIGHVLISLFVGCIVAAAAKGREMVATMTLGLVPLVMTATIFCLLVTRHQPVDPTLLPAIMIRQFCSSILIVIGGVIVRQIRSPQSRRVSGAVIGR
jgi:hypothetical protein